MEKPDKSGRVKINANTKATGSIDPDIIKQIQNMTPAFLEAMKKKEGKKTKQRG